MAEVLDLAGVEQMYMMHSVTSRIGASSRWHDGIMTGQGCVSASRGAVRGGKVRTILRAHDGRGPPEGET